jgi:DNA-binding transcriptional ArsR family regulator
VAATVFQESAAPPTSSGGRSFEAYADATQPSAAQALEDAAAVVSTAPAPAEPAANATSSEYAARADGALAFVVTASALEGADRVDLQGSLEAAAPGVVHTPVLDAKQALAQAPTPTVARFAMADRVEADTLGTDAEALGLASQALADNDPAAAAAVNAELRFQQQADGSFGGDVKATAEAVRALALGASAADRLAAARGLDWLDARQSLTPQEATYRLRAHGLDGYLANPQTMDAHPPPEAAMAGSIVPSGPGAKGVLALLFLAGGIGLSLTLVTSDALKGARRRLYDTVKAEPGLHVNELRRRLKMSPSSIEYHLAVLTGAGLVVSEDDGRYKRFYANGAGLGLNPGSPNSRNALGALRRPHARAIVQHLLDRGEGTAREVSRALSLHESAASRRLDHLERAGLLLSERVGRERRYQVRNRDGALKALSLVEAAARPPGTELARDLSAERSSGESLHPSVPSN